MTKADRDRLVTLKKANEKVITQSEAATELQVTVRHVKRMLKALRQRGDEAVVHRLRGVESNRKVGRAVQEEAIRILSMDVYRGFGPTLAGEHLAKKHGIEVSRETVRKFMQTAGLWKGRRRSAEAHHTWRQRRRRRGELVQWDTSEHDWLEGRSNERLYLISMIDDATSRYYARFVGSDSTEENMRTLWGYLGLYGRPLAFYTDKATLFRTPERRRRDEPGVDQDPKDMPPTQIGRALRELDIVWIGAHSPQAKGRVERSFDTAQDRLVKEMRVAGVRTLEEANAFLANEFLPWWNEKLTVEPASPDDAHRCLDAEYDLASILSHVETRQVKGDYTVQFEGERYAIDTSSIPTGLRGGIVRVEKRMDGGVAIRFADRFLQVSLCPKDVRTQGDGKPVATPPTAKRVAGRKKSKWMEGFWEKPSPTIDKAIRIANANG